MGGVFNTVNLHVYHYAGNNPVKYTDPDGEFATVVGTIIGGIAGGVSALTQGHKLGSKGFWAGVAGGAVSGAISGLAIDITVATGGAGAIAIIGVGGALGGGLGSVSESIISGEQLSLANIAGDALLGGISNLAGFGVSKLVASKFSNILAKELTTEGSKLYNAIHSSVLSTESGTLLMDKILKSSKLAAILVDQGINAALTYITDRLQDAVNLGEK